MRNWYRTGRTQQMKRDSVSMDNGRSELSPYGVRATREKDGYTASIPWVKARASLFSCKVKVLFIAGFALSGCYPIPIIPRGLIP